MKTIELDTATHDLKFTNGRLSLIEERDADRQRIETSLSWYRGEWFLAPSSGVPYYDRILIKNMNEGDVLSLLRSYLLALPAVQVVQELEIDTDATIARGITIRGSVVDSTGEVVQIYTTIGA